jgi:MFS family permease
LSLTKICFKVETEVETDFVMSHTLPNQRHQNCQHPNASHCLHTGATQPAAGVAQTAATQKLPQKRKLNGFGLVNMSFGFFGIQFGWSLQMANMSAIFEYLGAAAHQIPILWLAGPLTGLIVQPIIGWMSDRTWCWLGRRRPYFLAGAIASSLALVAMPHASSLWMAAGLLWILDTGANVSMEPFRAFVGDILPDEQHTQGYALQSVFIGLGAVLASALPWLLSHNTWFDLSHGNSALPWVIQLSFYCGAAVFLGSVLWTVFTTPEYSPAELSKFFPKTPKTTPQTSHSSQPQAHPEPRFDVSGAATSSHVAPSVSRGKPITIGRKSQPIPQCQAMTLLRDRPESLTRVSHAVKQLVRSTQLHHQPDQFLAVDWQDDDVRNDRCNDVCNDRCNDVCNDLHNHSLHESERRTELKIKPTDLRPDHQPSAWQSFWAEMIDAVRTMPATMRQLAWVQVFSWLGLFCVFLYFPPVVAHHVFGAASQAAPRYTAGIEWAGVCLALSNGVGCLASLVLPKFAQRWGHVPTHAVCLAVGAVSLMSLSVVHHQFGILVPMAGLGVAWAGILSLPYAILVSALPEEKLGTYMGMFNAFIVVPEIFASLGLGWMMVHWFHESRLAVVVIGGAMLLVAAVCALRVQMDDRPQAQTTLPKPMPSLPDRRMTQRPRYPYCDLDLSRPMLPMPSCD